MDPIRGRLVTIVMTALLIGGAFGCSGDKSTSYNLEQEFLQYEESELVDFSFSGDAKCASCDPNEVSGLYVELVSELSPTTEMSTKMLNGLGNFHISGLRSVIGSTVEVYGTLLFEGKSDASALRARITFQVPDDDDATAVGTLRFGQ